MLALIKGVTLQSNYCTRHSNVLCDGECNVVSLQNVTNSLPESIACSKDSVIYSSSTYNRFTICEDYHVGSHFIGQCIRFMLNVWN